MEIKELNKLQRDYFNSHETFDVNFRLQVLKDIKKLLIKYSPRFKEAFLLDYNKSEFDYLSTELLMVIDECDYMIKHLKSLTRVKKARTSILNWPSKGYILAEPYGVVLIMAPWNYPLQLSLAPLMGAIAGGNCVTIKPASYTANVSATIYGMFKELNRPELISVILGGRKENQDLLDQHFDYIFFTGGETVGRLVLEKASVWLTPVSLELGGKSPCIVHSDADIDLACKRIVWGKYLNAGQTCVAPDYICVHRSVHDEFLSKAKEYIKRYFYDENDKLVKTFPYLINQKHFDKVTSLIDENKIAFGGKSDGLCLEPTILDNVDFEDKIMEEEIFGPVMPIIIYDDLFDLLRIINERPKPLAFYFFSKNKKIAKNVFSHMAFGGGCYNDVIMHLTNDNLPFGGVGRSGMGSYHGQKSFDTFTHYKSLFKKGKFEINLKYPPISKNKTKLLKKIIGIKK